MQNIRREKKVLARKLKDIQIGVENRSIKINQWRKVKAAANLSWNIFQDKC